ncbi:glycosyltransferase family 39 protein [Curtobacterium flaccumfaciens]|nr:glycosyltransferase family 39 protein [Curtobacterium flaccumfaciens]
MQAALQEQTTGDASTWSTMSELLDEHPGDSAAVDQMTQHPPTAYLVDAVVLRALHYGSLRWDHALVVLRLWDAALVMPLALLAWASVRRVTRSPRAALAGALALFATPQLASIGASVTNDAPVMLLSGVVVWLATRILTGDLRARTLLTLGFLTAAVVWVKGTGLPAVPFVGLVALVAGGPALPFVRRLVRTVVVLAVVAALGSWWWLRNLVVYETLQPDGYSSMRPPVASHRESTPPCRTSSTSPGARSPARSGAARAAARR